MNKASSLLTMIATIGLIIMSSSHATAASTDNTTTHEQDLAAAVPTFLQLEITSSCTQKGSIIKIINRGKKWPRHGVLHLYHTDDKSVMTNRKLRLAPMQQVAFVISREKSEGRPIGMWIEPEWYKREFDYDAKLAC